MYWSPSFYQESLIEIWILFQDTTPTALYLHQTSDLEENGMDDKLTCGDPDRAVWRVCTLTGCVKCVRTPTQGKVCVMEGVVLQDCVQWAG